MCMWLQCDATVCNCNVIPLCAAKVCMCIRVCMCGCNVMPLCVAKVCVYVCVCVYVWLQWDATVCGYGVCVCVYVCVCVAAV